MESNGQIVENGRMLDLLPKILGGTCCCGLPLLLIVVFGSDAIKSRRRLAKARGDLSEQDIEEIRVLIAQATSEIPSAAILERTKQPAVDNECLIHIPEDLDQFPWAGKTVRFTFENRCFQCSFVESDFRGVKINGWVYKIRYVPRIKLKSGKVQNVFGPKRLMDLSPELRKIAKQAFPEEPERFLAEFFNYSREDSRIGGSPSWPQGPQFPTCSLCRKRMTLVIQLSPGDIKTETDAIVFFWGCLKHPDVTETTYDFY